MNSDIPLLGSSNESRNEWLCTDYAEIIVTRILYAIQSSSSSVEEYTHGYSPKCIKYLTWSVGYQMISGKSERFQKLIIRTLDLSPKHCYIVIEIYRCRNNDWWRIWWSRKWKWRLLNIFGAFNGSKRVIILIDYRLFSIKYWWIKANIKSNSLQC